MTVKFSINSWVFKDLSLSEALREISKLGFNGVEIPIPSEEYDSTKITELKSDLERLKVSPATVFCIELAKAPEEYNLNSEDEKIRGKAISYVKECIDVASKIGCELVLVASSPLTNRDRGELISYLTKSINECVAYAAERGVNIVLEHFPNRVIDTTDRLVEFVKMISSERFHGLLDTGHLNVLNEKLGEAVRKTGKILKHIHFNNNYGEKDTHNAVMDGTLGDSEFLDCLKALREIGYRGYYSFELMNVKDPWEDARQSKRYIEELLNRV